MNIVLVGDRAERLSELEAQLAPLGHTVSGVSFEMHRASRPTAERAVPRTAPRATPHEGADGNSPADVGANADAFHGTPTLVVVVHEKDDLDLDGLSSVMSATHATPPNGAARIVLCLVNSPADLARAYELGATDVLPRTAGAEVLRAKVSLLAELLVRRSRGMANDVDRPSIEQLTGDHQERFAALFRSLDEGVCVIEMIFDELDRPVDYLFLETNPAFEKLTGLVSCIGKTRREVSPVHDQHWFEMYGRAATTGEPMRLTHQASALSQRWFDVYASRIGGPGSRKVAVVFSDITARRRTEDALRDTQARLEATLGAGEVATWTWNIREDRVFADRNLALLFSVSDTDASGGPIAAYMHAIHVDDRARVGELIRQSISLGHAYEAEYRIVRPDGAIRAVVARGRVENDSEGKPLWLPGVVLDITRRKEAEEVLRVTEARLQFALKAGRMGTWDLDLQTGHLSSSPTCKANYGRPGDEPFTYEQLASSVVADDRARWGQIVESAIAEARGFDVEYRVAWPDRSVHWVHVRASCTLDIDGKAIAMSGVSLNIDERKLIEEELRTADRRKDEFLATASHELRTPLNAILGWSRMLRSGQLDPSGYLRAVETIERNAKAQVQLIEDILDGSRIITGKLHLEIRPLDMTALVRAAVDVVRPAAEAKSIDLKVVVDPTAARIVGDPDRLQQVVWNLANNAIKFTPKGGSVEMLLARKDTHIELSVKDTGQGISADFLPHVFERFRQAEGSTTRRHGGLGLGLALVRHLVDAHGGTVEVTSEGEGRGATFTVKLPVQAVFAETEELTRPTPTDVIVPLTATNLRGVTAIVVDDEADARDLVATVLRASGAEVTLAASVEQAIEAITASPPMVILSDIGMPGADGYELIRRVRTQTGTRGATVPAIALTAYAREEDRRLALEAGFQTHVAKPVEPAELLRVVSGLVQYMSLQSTMPERHAALGRADTLLKLQNILETQGVYEVLRALNSRTPHRFTGIYRFDPPTLRNVHLVDAITPAVTKGDDPPMVETYCSLVGQTGQTFTTEDTRVDDRLRTHPARENVLSYCGVLLRDEAGRSLGTLCHFDLVPCDVPTAEITLMEALAPRIVKALRGV